MSYRPYSWSPPFREDLLVPGPSDTKSDFVKLLEDMEDRYNHLSWLKEYNIISSLKKEYGIKDEN